MLHKLKSYTKKARGHNALVIEYNCLRGDTVNAPRTRIPLQSEKNLHEGGKLLDQPQSSLNRVSQSREGRKREPRSELKGVVILLRSSRIPSSLLVRRIDGRTSRRVTHYHPHIPCKKQWIYLKPSRRQPRTNVPQEKVRDRRRLSYVGQYRLVNTPCPQVPPYADSDAIFSCKNVHGYLQLRHDQWRLSQTTGPHDVLHGKGAFFSRHSCVIKVGWDRNLCGRASPDPRDTCQSLRYPKASPGSTQDLGHIRASRLVVWYVAQSLV